VTAPDKSPARIAAMFDAIASRYDVLNHVLSAGLDTRWRARAIRELALTPGARIVDLCTGTADLALAAVTAVPRARVVGIDFAGAMLRLGLVRGDAVAVPVGDGRADAAMMAFGIRNVAEPERALRELARVLAPGGRLAILEFGEPAIPGVRALYRWYFRQVLPRLGRIVSRHESAYSYLPASVGAFPSPAEFASVIARNGFADVRSVRLSLGIVYLYVARRA
jgi:demethylmenaquinone methyltransferase / 2-methoxy-6-polyprenyl-1,4-benzoquinol methylase